LKAIVYREYGAPEVLKIQEVEKPAPKENEVLIKVHAVSVNFGDLLARKFREISPSQFFMPFLFWLPAKIAFGLRKPRISILGNEFAGEVESIGKDVKKFKEGDRVFGYRGQSMGAYAQYLCVSEKSCLAIKPDNMTEREAAVLPGGAMTALSLLGKMNIQPGQKVLINGASGGIGSAALQLAKNHYGAEVTGVCSTMKVDYVKALGAHRVIDYTKEDFTEGNETYDLIFDILGKSSFSHCKHSLKENGRYLLASFKIGQLLQMLWTSMMGKKKVICAIAPEKLEDLITIKKLAEAGKIKSIIDKSFPMEQAAEAHRYMEEGKAKGKVVITLD